MKTVLFLVGDYWHHSETIEPLKNILFDEEEWEVVFTEEPVKLMEMKDAPDLIISFKDPIENDQIPTPVWCDESWTNRLFECVHDNGTGLILVYSCIHCWFDYGTCNCFEYTNEETYPKGISVRSYMCCCGYGCDNYGI